MSADNYLLIKKDGGSWIGYLESESSDLPTYNNMVFKVITLEDAINHGQKTETEYGMRFDLGDESTKSSLSTAWTLDKLS